jgi:uncharacterized protein YqeY
MVAEAGGTDRADRREAVCYEAIMLTDEIRARAKEMMKSGDTLGKDVLRVALGEVQTEEARRGSALDDAAVEKILRKLIKSNSETIAVAEDPERRAALERENVVLQSFLPKTLGEDDVVAALAPVLDDIKAAKADGPATGIAMKYLKSQDAAIDGKTVAAAVKRLRS